MKKQPNKIIGLSIFTIILIAFIIIWFVTSPKTYMQPQEKETIGRESFTSDNLDISFEAQTPVLMKDLLTNVILEYDGREIIISRSASDYQTLDEYLTRLIELNNMNVKRREDITIDGSPGVILFTDSQGVDHPTYFVVKNEWVYSMYTIHPELFDDLDNVAKTFKYHSAK